MSGLNRGPVVASTLRQDPQGPGPLQSEPGRYHPWELLKREAHWTSGSIAMHRSQTAPADSVSCYYQINY